jgi:hypothetical protein
MKNLSTVIKEDALEIIKAGYSTIMFTGRWKLTDEYIHLDEPCKKLSSKRKVYIFWFFDDKIDIDLIDDKINFNDINFDVKLACYVKAHQLGYFIPELEKI